MLLEPGASDLQKCEMVILSSMQVLLLSAQDAMLSRLILRGKAGKEERLRFGKLAFGARKAASTPDEDFQQVRARLLPLRLTQFYPFALPATPAATSGPFCEADMAWDVRATQSCFGLLEPCHRTYAGERRQQRRC